MNHLNDIVLHCQDISHSFGPKRVLHRVDLKVVRGEIVGLVGPSGCGKSTLLNMILGTYKPSVGKVVVYHGNGQTSSSEVSSLGPDRGIVFQRYSLYPWRTALENVALGLKLRKTSYPFRIFRPFTWSRLSKIHLKEAEQLLIKLNLGDSMDCYPYELSGGMCQRVAIAQALITKPDILLLDEPFGALDEATRESLQRMLLRLYAENLQALKSGAKPPYTIVIVTHEIREAIFVSDRVVAISPFWDWQGLGHNSCPGATVVYDQPAPVFKPDDPRDFEKFVEQQNEIFEAGFDPKRLKKRMDFTDFWKQVEAGDGEGVLSNGHS
jgi:NitT/TauT family transport system ATP-binding protein